MDDNCKRTTRRSYLESATIVGIAGLAGCLGGNGSSGGQGGNGSSGGQGGNGSSGGQGGNGSSGGQGGNSEYNWTMAVSVGEGHAFEIGAQAFKEAIESRSSGRFSIDVAAGGAYGSEIEQMETVAAGGVEMISQSLGVGTATRISGKAFGTIGTAWIYEDPIWEHHMNVWERLNESIDMRAEFAKQGLKTTTTPIYAGERNIASNSPFQEPSDISDVPIRVPEVPGWSEYFSELGFGPVSMPITEVYQALQTGTIQASEGEVMQLVSQNTVEVQSHYNITQHFPNGFWFHINTDLFNSLPAKDQDTVLEASDEAKELAEERIRERESKLLNQLKSGNQITVVEDVQQQKFSETVRPLIKNWLQENSARLSLSEIENLAP